MNNKIIDINKKINKKIISISRNNFMLFIHFKLF